MYQIFIKKGETTDFESIGLLELDWLEFIPYGVNYLRAETLKLTDELKERIENILPESFIVEYTPPPPEPETLPTNHIIVRKVIKYLISKVDVSGTFKDKIDYIFKNFKNSIYSENDDFKVGFIEFLKSNDTFLRNHNNRKSHENALELWSGNKNSYKDNSDDDLSDKFYNNICNTYFWYHKMLITKYIVVKTSANFIINLRKWKYINFKDLKYEEITLEGDKVLIEKEGSFGKFKIIMRLPKNGDIGKLVVIWCSFVTNYNWIQIENFEDVKI